MNLTFDNASKKFILDIFDKTVDSESFIVEKHAPSQRVLTLKGDEIKLRQFAGIRKGSEVFIKSDIDSLIEASDHLR